jgi:lipoprotein-releasing system ATP-binding protein
MGPERPEDGSMKLTVATLRKEFKTPAGPLVVLRDVSLEVSPGETLAVVGPSGSGKSTLLNIIGALDKPSSGSVRLGEIEVTALEGAGLAEYRARRVGFVFQDHHLLPQCSALENVVLPTLPAGNTAGAVERARGLLERVGLGERIDAMPGVLSGGERQRVAIARALINDPPVLLCDEPTGNLDIDAGRMITRLFMELAREHDVSLVMVTHNLELAGLLDRVRRLRDGVLGEAEPAKP